MENVGLLKQFSMDQYIGDLHNCIYEIVQAKEDEKVMKEIGFIAAESLRALYAYKRNHKDNEIIFDAVTIALGEIVTELRQNDWNLAEMLGEKDPKVFELEAKLKEFADMGINVPSKKE